MKKNVHRILIIDDSVMLRNLLKRILIPQGYQVCGETSNGKDGLQKYKDLKPDLVFLDISMPGMDGMECLRLILEFDPAAKVIMCTAQGKENFSDKAIDIGAKSFIIKPLKTAKVIDTCSRVMAGGGIDYKDWMTENSLKFGLSQKDVLDFFDAFRSLTGKDMGDISVDRAFLREKKDSVVIGANAFLSAKHSRFEIKKLTDVFSDLC